MKLFEILPWIKDFIKVNVAPHGFALSFSRSCCFLYGLKDVELLGSKYGYNSMYINQVMHFLVIILKMSLPDMTLWYYVGSYFLLLYEDNTFLCANIIFMLFQ